MENPVIACVRSFLNNPDLQNIQSVLMEIALREQQSDPKRFKELELDIKLCELSAFLDKLREECNGLDD